MRKNFFFLITIGAFLSLLLTPILASANSIIPKPDFILQYNKSTNTTFEVIFEEETTNSLIRMMTVPLTFSGEQVGFFKTEDSRIKAKNTNGTTGLETFVTANDTFYLKEAGMIFFGRRKCNDESMELTGRGTVQEIILDSQNEIIELKMLYVFDADEEEINFYFQQ